MSPHLYPRVSIVDPVLQLTLPWNQTVNGLVDSQMHILEALTYIDEPEKAEAAFQLGVGLIKTIIKLGYVLQKEPHNLTARTNFCWASTCAYNGLCATGLPGMCKGVHSLEYAMSGVDPRVAHAEGIAVAFPAFTRAVGELGKREKQYRRIAEEVYGR